MKSIEELSPALRYIFRDIPYLEHLGIELADVGEGWCETRASLSGFLVQQDGYAHAGAIASLADHTAGGAAGTLVADDQTVVTVEFKINFLRPAVGNPLVCRSKVLRAGRKIIIAESEVLTGAASDYLVAKAMVTLSVAQQRQR